MDRYSVVLPSVVGGMFQRKRGVRFGEKIVPRYLTPESLLELLHNDLTIDYTLLMPVLLFLPCYTTPVAMLQILISNFKKLSLISSQDSGIVRCSSPQTRLPLIELSSQ
jgi:hypothetical protein